MKRSNQDLYEIYNQWNTEDLIKASTTDKQDYRDEAVEIMLRILNTRDLEDQVDKDDLKEGKTEVKIQEIKNGIKCEACKTVKEHGVASYIIFPIDVQVTQNYDPSNASTSTTTIRRYIPNSQIEIKLCHRCVAENSINLTKIKIAYIISTILFFVFLVASTIGYNQNPSLGYYIGINGSLFIVSIFLFILYRIRLRKKRKLDNIEETDFNKIESFITQLDGEKLAVKIQNEKKSGVYYNSIEIQNFLKEAGVN